MEVLSPVGRFPLRLTSARLSEGKVQIRANMGAWRSEINLGREDGPLVGACLGGLVVAFVLGRMTARRG